MSEDDPSNTKLTRARGYPYPFPEHSFLYRDSGPAPFDPARLRHRTPVLAIGSNQAPERLAQKFGHDASHEIPVQRAWLDDFDVVYSAHVASYGAIPAMLQVSRSSRVAVAVTWLDDRQLEIMHRSEIGASNYSFAEMEQVRLTLDDGRVETSAFAYVSVRGHLSHDGQPIALASIACERRRYPALSTAEMLERVRQRVAPQTDSDTFIHQLVDDADYRRAIVAALASDAIAFAHPVNVLREGPSR